MTIVKLVELLGSKLGVLIGERMNASAFNNFDEKKINILEENLFEYGYDGGGLETMVNGITGMEMSAQIFIGPMYYQRLRHLVADKIQARDKGPLNPLTREPVKGRKRMGGLRFGEMERDAVLSHGASALVMERMCYSANPYPTVYCTNCGNIAIQDVQAKQIICRTCNNPDFGKCTIPYVHKLITHYVGAAGIKITQNFGRKLYEGTTYTQADEIEENEKQNGELDSYYEEQGGDFTGFTDDDY